MMFVQRVEAQIIIELLAEVKVLRENDRGGTPVRAGPGARVAVSMINRGRGVNLVDLILQIWKDLSLEAA